MGQPRQTRNDALRQKAVGFFWVEIWQDLKEFHIYINRGGWSQKPLSVAVSKTKVQFMKTSPLIPAPIREIIAELFSEQ